MERLKFLFVFTLFLPLFDCKMNLEELGNTRPGGNTKKEADLLEELKVWIDDVIEG